VSHLVAIALAVVLGRVLLGPWPTAVALAALGVWWGMRVWQQIEARARRREARAVVLRPFASVPQPGARVTLARALAVAAVAYLAECEREVNQP
jgi:hypothetical protein